MLEENHIGELDYSLGKVAGQIEKMRHYNSKSYMEVNVYEVREIAESVKSLDKRLLVIEELNEGESDKDLKSQTNGKVRELRDYLSQLKKEIISMQDKAKEFNEKSANIKVEKPNPPIIPSPPKTEETREKSKFKKQNWKLGVYGFIFAVGLIWLFSYLASLSEHTGVIWLSAGFIVSAGTIAWRFKKVTSKRVASVLSLIGYLVGILTILLGSIDLISSTAAVGSSLIYLAFGIKEMNTLKSEIFSGPFVVISMFAAISYLLIDIPAAILFVYVIALLICVNRITDSKKTMVMALWAASITSSILILSKMFGRLEEAPIQGLLSLILSIIVLGVILLVTLDIEDRIELDALSRIVNNAPVYAYLAAEMFALGNTLQEADEFFMWTVIALIAVGMIASTYGLYKGAHKLTKELSLLFIMSGILLLWNNLDVTGVLLSVIEVLALVVLLFAAYLVSKKKDWIASKYWILIFMIIYAILCETDAGVLAVFISSIAMAAVMIITITKNHYKELAEPIIYTCFATITYLSMYVKAIADIEIFGLSYEAVNVINLIVILGLQVLLLKCVKNQPAIWYGVGIILAVTLVVIQSIANLSTEQGSILYSTVVLIVNAIVTFLYVKVAKNADKAIFSILSVGFWITILYSVSNLIAVTIVPAEVSLSNAFSLMSVEILLGAVLMFGLLFIKAELRSKFIAVYLVAVFGFITRLFVLVVSSPSLIMDQENFALTDIPFGIRLFEVIMLLVLAILIIKALFFASPQMHSPLHKENVSNKNLFIHKIFGGLSLIYLGVAAFKYLVPNLENTVLLIVGTLGAIVYIVVIKKHTEEIGSLSKGYSIATNLLILGHLFYLILVPLGDLPFVLKGIVFLVIGGYGLYKALKANK